MSTRLSSQRLQTPPGLTQHNAVLSAETREGDRQAGRPVAGDGTSRGPECGGVDGSGVISTSGITGNKSVWASVHNERFLVGVM